MRDPLSTLALVKALEDAPTGSRELDAEIALVIDFHEQGKYSLRKHVADRQHTALHKSLIYVAHWSFPHYTTNTDAALTLLPRHMDYELTILGTPDGETYTCAGIRWWSALRAVAPKEWKHRSGNKLAPAHAICIAAVKTMEALSVETA